MLGERLQEIRKDHGLSQQQLADRLHVSIHTISSYERNCSAPDDATKIKIAKLFNISLDYLLGLVDERHSYDCVFLPEGFGVEEKAELREFIAYLHFKRIRKNRSKHAKNQDGAK